VLVWFWGCVVGGGGGGSAVGHGVCQCVYVYMPERERG